jgi:hypothetical protein
MIEFIKNEFHIDVNSVQQLKSEMKEYRWYSEFVDLDEKGQIILFDISHGCTKDAIQQVIDLLDENGKSSVKLDIIVSDNDETLSYTFDSTNNQIIEKVASGYIGS